MGYKFHLIVSLFISFLSTVLIHLIVCVLYAQLVFYDSLISLFPNVFIVCMVFVNYRERNRKWERFEDVSTDYLTKNN
jgi:hypothetical protein